MAAIGMSEDDNRPRVVLHSPRSGYDVVRRSPRTAIHPDPPPFPPPGLELQDTTVQTLPQRSPTSRKAPLIIAEWIPRRSLYMVPPPQEEWLTGVANVERISRSPRYGFPAANPSERSSSIAIVERAPRAARYIIARPDVPRRSSSVAVAERIPGGKGYSSLTPAPACPVYSLDQPAWVVERSPGIPAYLGIPAPDPSLIVPSLHRPIPLPAAQSAFPMPQPQPYPVFITTQKPDPVVSSTVPEAPTAQPMRSSSNEPGQTNLQLRQTPTSAEYSHQRMIPKQSSRTKQLASASSSLVMHQASGNQDDNCNFENISRPSSNATSLEVFEVALRAAQIQRGRSQDRQIPSGEISQGKSEHGQAPRLLEAPQYRVHSFQLREERTVVTEDGRRKKQYYYV